MFAEEEIAALFGGGLPTEFSVIDLVAVGWFLVAWVAYTWVADHSPMHRRSMTAAMAEMRVRWMLNLVQRDNRIVDSQILGNLLQGTAFFASTSILLVGALAAGLGATERAVAVLGELPVVAPTTALSWEIKILLMMAVFVYAFFKFGWAFRLFNYCSILMGAVPIDPADPDAERIARCASRVNGLAARHFNWGLRAYFFALAALGWFIHPYVFIATTTWVVVVLYRREFASKSLDAVKSFHSGS